MTSMTKRRVTLSLISLGVFLLWADWTNAKHLRPPSISDFVGSWIGVSDDTSSVVRLELEPDNVGYLAVDRGGVTTLYEVERWELRMDFVTGYVQGSMNVSVKAVEPSVPPIFLNYITARYATLRFQLSATRWRDPGEIGPPANSVTLFRESEFRDSYYSTKTKIEEFRKAK
jgi:hypothetical protein